MFVCDAAQWLHGRGYDVGFFVKLAKMPVMLVGSPHSKCWPDQDVFQPQHFV